MDFNIKELSQISAALDLWANDPLIETEEVKAAKRLILRIEKEIIKRDAIMEKTKLTKFKNHRDRCRGQHI